MPATRIGDGTSEAEHDTWDNECSESEEHSSLSVHPVCLRAPEPGQPIDTSENLPSNSSSARHRLLSSSTSHSLRTAYSTVTVADDFRRPSMLRRLRSSISTTSSKSHMPRRPIVHPSDFREPPEVPENRFVDSAGVVIPGVCDRVQCTHSRVHFVFAFRLSETMEYTTTLAEHGITYTDYVRLIDAVWNLCTELSMHNQRSSRDIAARFSTERQRNTNDSHRRSVLMFSEKHPAVESIEFDDQLKQQAAILNQLLEDISQNLQARKVPVTFCVSSFSLFAPDRVLEAHLQVLHTPLAPRKPQELTKDYARTAERLSFINPDTSLDSRSEDTTISWRCLNENIESSPVPAQSASRPVYDRKYSQSRVRVKPWSLWPNAIPSNKRQVMSENADRYGEDPYFRVWMRANFNSYTTFSTYSKYMIEQENDPFVDTRLAYVDTPLRRAPVWKTSTNPNQSKYQHNRRLELCRAIEGGQRLRVVRLGGYHLLYPPHNPELEELGLSKDAYEAIVRRVDQIKLSSSTGAQSPFDYLLSLMGGCRKRTSDDVLLKLSDYIRHLNAAQRRIVWTLETIPGMYGNRGHHSEWEISAWNGEDPLELLTELERWGIVKQTLDVDGKATRS